MTSHIFECKGASRHIWGICRAVDGGILLIRPHGAAPNVIWVGHMHTDAKIEQAGLPPASQLMSSYGRADFADAFSIDLPEAASHDAECIARHIFDHQPEWTAVLLKLRDLLVRPFGLKGTADLRGAGGDRINIFRIFGRYPNEIVLGEDDTHLNFRVSVLVQPPSGERSRRVIVTTLVFCNRLLGRAYIALIAPFHRMVVRGSLRQAQRIGWPA